MYVNIFYCFKKINDDFHFYLKVKIKYKKLHLSLLTFCIYIAKIILLLTNPFYQLFTLPDYFAIIYTFTKN